MNTDGQHNTQALRLVLSKLHDSGVEAVLGGSGLLHALTLTDVTHDWDLTTNAPMDAVKESLQRSFHIVDRVRTSTVFCSSYVLSLPGEDVEIIGGYAIRSRNEVCKLPSLSGGTWEGIPLASPEVWAVAYHLMGRLDKSELLFHHLQRTGISTNVITLLLQQPLPSEMSSRLERMLRDGPC